MTEPNPGIEQPRFKSDSSQAEDELMLAMFSRLHAKPEVFGDDEDEFVIALRKLKQQLGMNDTSVVIYPGSGTHVGVARVFGKDNVIHVDPDVGSTEVLAERGYLAAASRVEEYSPVKPVDAMVALNSYGVPTAEMVTRLVKPGGYVIANNWTHWAADLAKFGETLELRGAVMPTYQTPDAKFVDAEELPQGVTDIVKQFFVIESGGSMKPGTPEEHAYIDESATYPDALFVFKRI